MKAVCKLGDVILENYALPKGSFLEGQLPLIIRVPNNDDDEIVKDIKDREYQITFVRKRVSFRDSPDETIFYAEVKFDQHLMNIMIEFGWQLSSVLPN